MKQIIQRMKFEVSVDMDEDKILTEPQLQAIALDCPSYDTVYDMVLNCLGGYKSIVRRGIRIKVEPNC